MSSIPTASSRVSRALVPTLLAALLATRAAAQAPPMDPPAEEQPATATAAPGDLPPLEAPPELNALKSEQLKRAIKKLRNDSDKHRKSAEQEVIGFGRGAIPFLEEAATTNDVEMMDALVNCLCGVADARDRDRIQAHVTSQLAVLRRFAARSSGTLHIPALLDAIAPLLDDADQPTSVEAALALVSNGREEGLAIATLAFGGLYGEGWRDRVLAALPGVSGKGQHEPIARLMVVSPEREKTEGDTPSKERLAAVQLLHAIGDREAKALLVHALDDPHNVVQREAINALRDLLEGQGPLQASSIFQQLNEVKRLKEVAAAAKV